MKQPNHTSVRKRKNGTYELRYWENGRQHSIYGKTKTELFQKYLERAPKEERAEKGSQTFENFYLLYFEQFKQPKVTEYTYKLEKRKIERYVLPCIGQRKLHQITTLDISALLNQITASRTKQDIYKLLNEILKKAKLLKFIKDNPVEIIDRPHHKRKLGKSLTKKEEKAFLELAPLSKYGDILLFLRYSGARRGEALRLSREDIDLDNKTIHLRGTKTDGSDRYIPLFDTILPLLSNLEEWKNWHQDTITGEFKKICPSHKLHDLRHTFATRCLEQGISMKTVQKWLGHSTYEQTANTYSHITSEFEQKEIEKVNKA